MVVSYRNSTSNHNSLTHNDTLISVVSYRNSTSNHNFSCINTSKTRVVSYRNSTSNHNEFELKDDGHLVVSYRNSTSNHNIASENRTSATVVSYRNSTSNHNCARLFCATCKLYLIEILHQTTTCCFVYITPSCCILSKFYIKPQRTRVHEERPRSCILSKFYIKPQPRSSFPDFEYVVSYRNSTSNHNSCLCISEETALYLIEILHQTTTSKTAKHRENRCILSKFYIKPQRMRRMTRSIFSCILSKFYIKPQRRASY